MSRASPMNMAALPKRAKKALAVKVRSMAELIISECENAVQLDKAMSNCNQWFVWGIFTAETLTELQRKANEKMKEFQKEIDYESNN